MLYIYIGFMLVVAWAIIAPTKRGGTRAQNGFIVTLPTDEITLLQNNHPRGRRNQEVVEFRLHWLFGAIFSLLLSALLFSFGAYDNMAQGVSAGFFILFAALGHRLLREVTYGLDIVGHTVEILTAEEDGWDSTHDVPYRKAEILRMLNDGRRVDLKFPIGAETTQEAEERAFATVYQRIKNVEPFAKVVKKILTF